MYEDELKFLGSHEDPADDTNGQRTIFSTEEINNILMKYPGLPESYTTYLVEIGAGPFRECQYEVFDTPCYFEELYEVGFEFEPKRYIAFGHNFSGDTSVFDAKQEFTILDFWHDSLEFYNKKMSFKSYIKEKMLIGLNGEDLRVNA
ncbi:hypothetical protein [Pseudomonas sp.]|uniref:hypothetical protein n=1 Tax=Pseudomonas sp. TaxID=306 RepID=UPI002CB192AE|nr:hypothetical protein [Pseudomonas sp.]HUE92224.1 hypothetical protein [Pseudomonas sp.]